MRLGPLLCGLALCAVLAGCAGTAPPEGTAATAAGETPAKVSSAAPPRQASRDPADLLGLPPPRERAEPQIIAQWRGEAAPEFQLALLSGGSLNLADLRGKPAVINFWASWCPPCRAEMPAFERSWQKDGDRIAFVGVAVQDTEPEARAAVEKTGVTYPVGLDEGNRIARAYELKGMPTTVVLDANGVIVKRFTGEATEGALTFFINTLLRQTP